MTALARYDAARAALADAVRVDEVLEVRDEAERFKLYARQAKDCDLLADATELHMRAECRLGEMIAAAKASGQVAEGRPHKDKNHSDPAAFRVTLKEAGISPKLSSRAQRLSGIAGQAFEALVAATREKIAAGGAVVIDPLRDLSTEQKQERRANRERVLGAIQCSLPDVKAGVILEDFEWHHETYSDAGMDRHAANHYETAKDALTPQQIVDRSAERFSIADANCVLFMWVTVQHLWIGMQVMALRGFAYKSHYAWGKDKIGLGYWNREKHELLLIGVKGNIPCPAPGTQWDSLVIAPRGKHSEKPDTFYEMIETYFPTMPKVEFNACKRREGWIQWGNQLPESSEAA